MMSLSSSLLCRSTWISLSLCPIVFICCKIFLCGNYQTNFPPFPGGHVPTPHKIMKRKEIGLIFGKSSYLAPYYVQIKHKVTEHFLYAAIKSVGMDVWVPNLEWFFLLLQTIGNITCWLFLFSDPRQWKLVPVELFPSSYLTRTEDFFILTCWIYFLHLQSFLTM